MEFVAVDVETANPDLSSICQIGIASFRDAELVDEWGALVNPEVEFDPMNVSIHGIDERAVRHAPKLATALQEAQSRIAKNIVVSHTPFDRVALTRASEQTGHQLWQCSWLDSARVVRRAWAQFARSGYGLSNVAAQLGIEYSAHNALEDAKCAGFVLLRAMAETGMSLDQWMVRVTQPITGSGHTNYQREGNPEGDLAGEVLVFTGTLSMSRTEAADAASSAGCRVENAVTKETTLLVVGDQDLRKLNGHSKSTKHRKAEQLIANGQQILIFSESDFRRLVLNH